MQIFSFSLPLMQNADLPFLRELVMQILSPVRRIARLIPQ